MNFYSYALFSQVVDQKISPIEVLQFHSSQERALFEAFFNGKNPPLAHFYLISESNSSLESSHALSPKWAKLIDKLKSRTTNKNPRKLLEHVFYKVHRKFLKDYKRHSSLQALLAKGDYDCLSGTSLYVLMLEELGYDYEIRETDYHIYLLVNSKEESSDQQFLLESTDPVSGFISDAKEIANRQKLLQEVPVGDQILAQGISTDNPEYQFSSKVNNSVSAYELAGLHYYNQGINSYNNHRYLESIRSLQKALFLYKSSRIEEFLDLAVSVALASEKLNAEEKQTVKILHEEWNSLYIKQKQEPAQNN